MWRGEKLVKETRHPAALQSGSDAAGSRVSLEEDVIEYHWGKDLSGTIGGAGGVGGLLYVKINGVIYVPWYDAYGNILGYWDAQGHVVAEYTYDAFGKLIASSGPMADVFSFRYSTKYFDPETGFYYYGYRFYSPELKRWITRDPIGEEGGKNLYAVCCNNLLAQSDLLGLFAIYVHEEGAVGHVGLRLANGSAYDYGRYRGTYSGLGLAFSGPNVLMTNKWNDISSSHEYTVFEFNVCNVIEDGVAKAAKSRFDKGHFQWPDDVRFAKFKKLRANERYMGTDWNWNDDNCMTFTFRTIVAGVKNAQESEKLPRKAARQAQTLLWLSFDACFQPTPKEIKSLLERYVQSCDWISNSK
jgi:RHS repeat-associated protein